VQIDSDFEAGDAAISPAGDSTPKPTAMASEPGVLGLVQAYSKASVPQAEAPLVTTASLQECVSAELAVPLIFATSGAYLAPVAAFKAGFDLGQCLGHAYADEVVKATMQNAADSCRADGGIVTAIVDNQVLCNMTAVER
jgi:hypothetical protein